MLAAVEAKPASPVPAKRRQPRLQLRALLLGWLWLASRRVQNQEWFFDEGYTWAVRTGHEDGELAELFEQVLDA